MLFNGLTSRLDTTEQRISELNNVSKESLKTKRPRGQRLKNRTDYPSTVRRLQKGVMPEGEEREIGTEDM